MLADEAAKLGERSQYACALRFSPRNLKTSKKAPKMRPLATLSSLLFLLLIPVTFGQFLDFFSSKSDNCQSCTTKTTTLSLIKDLRIQLDKKEKFQYFEEGLDDLLGRNIMY